jgi:hypothetical protein
MLGTFGLVRRYTADTEDGVRDLATRLKFWVDIDRRAEHDDGTVILPLFQGRQKRRFGISLETASEKPAGRLIVYEAVGIDIEDDARIGTYEIDEVFYDPEQRTLTLRSGFPMKLVIRVKRPHVCLELD